MSRTVPVSGPLLPPPPNPRLASRPRFKGRPPAPPCPGDRPLLPGAPPRHPGACASEGGRIREKKSNKFCCYIFLAIFFFVFLEFSERYADLSLNEIRNKTKFFVKFLTVKENHFLHGQKSSSEIKLNFDRSYSFPIDLGLCGA